MTEAKKTTDHKLIRQWAEERGGRPATVKGTAGSEEAGILRIAFSEDSQDSLKEISWEEFFDKFEQAGLAFLYQEETKGGETSRFFKLVNRD
jgi:hypothetical protein